MAAMILTGCVQYTGIPMATDDMVDESNQPYASAAQKEYDELQADIAAGNRHKVAIVEDKNMALFLSPAVGGHPICNNIAVRKELVLAFKGQLRERVAGLSDFTLLGEAETPMIQIGASAAPADLYRMSYNITSVELKENAGGTMAMSALAGVNQTMQQTRIYQATAKVEVRLFNPQNEVVFSFTGDGSDSSVSTDGPNKDMLMKAVREAANNAISGYVVKFGPPMYVTDTCQGGQFAKLSVGAKFGLTAGQKVEFYKNTKRKSATGAEEDRQIVVGSGIVGEHKAPVEDDYAWVFVDDFKPEARAVFRFTSARVMSVRK